MIAYVSGTLMEVEENAVVIENQGIGYQVFVPLSVMNQLPSVGQFVKLYTYMYVKEDILDLYGFMTKDDLGVFRLLITVNGIGPKGALGILSVLTSNDLRFAVAAGDDKTISQAPGIGKKTAQKLILELRDKLKLEDTLTGGSDAGENISTVSVQGEARQEAILALTALGYQHSQAAKAVSLVADAGNMTVEELLKEALKHME